MVEKISYKSFNDYRIIRGENIRNCIRANHSKKELYVSKDIDLERTDDGKLSAKFANFREHENKKILGFNISKKQAKTDCSLVISDPSKFNSCVQQNGIYQLSGSNLIFNGTKNGDNLILNGVSNSKINMQDGDDTVLYREKATVNNDINLGNGNNIFATRQRSDADKQLTQNRITSGKGDDYVYLRDAIGNTVETGAGKDLVEIEGGVNSRYPRAFVDNNISTGDGADTVTVNGSFGTLFTNNSFYLGKGSDIFSASINPEDDAKNEVEHNDRYTSYLNAVKDSKIYAKDFEKGLLGFMEKDTLETKTHTANELSGKFNIKACSEGFDKNIHTPIPQSAPIVKEEPKIQNKPRKLTREDYSARYYAGSLGYMLFKDPKMLESAFKALDEYVKSMVE